MTFEEFFANKIVKVLAEATSRFNFILFLFSLIFRLIYTVDSIPTKMKHFLKFEQCNGYT